MCRNNYSGEPDKCEQTYGRLNAYGNGNGCPNEGMKNE